MARFLILNITGAAILIAGWLHGFVKDVAGMDSTGMTWLIAAIFLVGLWRAYKHDWRGVDFAATLLPVLGVLGTVAGIVMVFGPSLMSGELINPSLGIGTALSTTGVGLAGHAWLVINRWVCE